MNAPARVQVDTVAVLEPSGWPVPTRLEWSAGDPLAVTVAFCPGRRARTRVAWALARELLDDGLRAACGMGDVRVEPFLDRVLLTLDNSAERAVFALPAGVVRGFLAATVEQVPLGAEQVDVDRAVALCRRAGGER